MLADPEFQKGVNTYFDEVKTVFADKIDKAAVKM